MRQKGFTIIELMMVIAVIGILAAIAVPRLGNSLREQELASSAQQLVSELRYVQQLNINASDMQTYKMVFSGNQYYIVSGVNIIKKIKLPSSVQIAGLPSDVTFSHFTGAPVFGSSQTIQLRSASLNKSLYVKIHPNRGRVRVDTSPGTD